MVGKDRRREEGWGTEGRAPIAELGDGKGFDRGVDDYGPGGCAEMWRGEEGADKEYLVAEKRVEEDIGSIKDKMHYCGK